MNRADRDEHALILFSRMLSRRPVWVDSDVMQQVWVEQIGIDLDGEVIAFDENGNDRRAEEYLLSPRSRCKNGHAHCDGNPMTCLTRESENMGLYEEKSS